MAYKISSKEVAEIEKVIKNKEKITVRQLQDAERGFLLSLFDDKILYIATSSVKARMIEKQLSSIGKRSYVLTQVIDAIFCKANLCEILNEYCLVLSWLYLNKIDAIIITPEVMLQKLPARDIYESEVIHIECGKDYNLSSLKSGLVGIGYKRVERVESQGEFSQRGDILDIFPLGYDAPVRIDFWGDNVESIKKIDVSTYASNESEKEIFICPHTLNLGAFDDKNLPLLDSEPEIKEKVLNNVKDVSLIYALPLYESFNSNFVKWFCANIVVIEEPKRVYDLACSAWEQYTCDIIRQIEEGILNKFHMQYYMQTKDLPIKEKQAVIGFTNLDVKNPLFFTENVVSMPIVNLSNYVINEELLKSDLQYFKNQGFTVVLCYQNDEQKSILQTMMRSFGFGCHLIENSDETKAIQMLKILENDVELKTINLINFPIAYSVGFLNEKFVLISSGSLFREVKKQTTSIEKSRVFYLPKVNDYVVHQTHGIGKCIEIKRMNLGFCEKDYIVIEYAKGDVLYLPTEHTDELSQYLGGEETPKLNMLGGEQFKKAKEKAKASLKKLAFDLRALYAKRSSLKGFKYSSDNYLVDEFQKACGFELTKDQDDAICEIKKDMESGKVMDRLICGDVGFGKTEVAMVAAFKTILDNKQVALLAPTTILCHQHYVTVQNRMKDFMVNVKMLSRFNTVKENDEVVKGLANGEVNIVCGTHRLLSNDVKFKDLGLLILDEEQRFGVADKEKIKNLKQNVNVLTLSATPIPRTLHMSLIGVRDTSLITTPPKSRLPITSIVCEFSPAILVEACKRE
ncbi:MAG: DEAD/DEAH box helicase, partial [Christensenellales bacterium]